MCASTRARSSPRTQHAKGSISVAASSDTESGSTSRSSAALRSGTRISSENPPGSIRDALKPSHNVSRPRAQYSHSPHGTW